MTLFKVELRWEKRLWLALGTMDRSLVFGVAGMLVKVGFR